MFRWLPWLEEARTEARNAVASPLDSTPTLAQIEREIEKISIEEAIDEALSVITHSTPEAGAVG
jgi:hypothetical protein